MHLVSLKNGQLSIYKVGRFFNNGWLVTKKNQEVPLLSKNRNIYLNLKNNSMYYYLCNIDW
jgi:hypothetical protein